MRKILTLSILCAAGFTLQADQILLQNGDRLNGKVISVSTNAIVLQSDVMGTLTLPRGKVSTLDFGGTVVTNPVPPKPQPMILSGARSAHTNSEVEAQLRQLTAQTNLIQQVQQGYLAGTTPEVQSKYNQMLNDLATGKMTMNDLRAQAKDAADQLRALAKESGDSDDSGTLNMYLSVLDNFLDNSGGQDTNAPAKALK